MDGSKCVGVRRVAGNGLVGVADVGGACLAGDGGVDVGDDLVVLGIAFVVVADAGEGDCGRAGIG